MIPSNWKLTKSDANSRCVLRLLWSSFQELKSRKIILKNEKRHKRIRQFLQKSAVVYAGNDFWWIERFFFHKFPLSLFDKLLSRSKIAEKHKDQLGPNFDLASYEAMIRQSLKAGFHFDTLLRCSLFCLATLWKPFLANTKANFKF